MKAGGIPPPGSGKPDWPHERPQPLHATADSYRCAVGVPRREVPALRLHPRSDRLRGCWLPKGCKGSSIGVQIGCDRGSESRRNAGLWAKGRGFESISLQRRVRSEPPRTAGHDRERRATLHRTRRWSKTGFERSVPPRDLPDRALAARELRMARVRCSRLRPESRRRRSRPSAPAARPASWVHPAERIVRAAIQPHVGGPQTRSLAGLAGRGPAEPAELKALLAPFPTEEMTAGR
jgi:hypothetical protein